MLDRDFGKENDSHPPEQAPSHLLPLPLQAFRAQRHDLEGLKSPWADLLHALK